MIPLGQSFAKDDGFLPNRDLYRSLTAESQAAIQFEGEPAHGIFYAVQEIAIPGLFRIPGIVDVAQKGQATGLLAHSESGEMPGKAQRGHNFRRGRAAV